MAIEIITDSTSDLTAQEARERNVHLIPMRVIFEDGVYQDGVDLDKETFYAKQAEAKILPKTTQLNPQEYCDVFQPLPEMKWWPFCSRPSCPDRTSPPAWLRAW